MSSKVIVLTGPSGVGKTYLIEQLLALHPDKFQTSKLYTTRPARSGEAGSDRVFVSRETFADKEQGGSLAITGTYHDNRYGYPVESLTPKEKHILINTWPAMIPRFAEEKNVVLVGLTVQVDSLPLLIERLQNRGETQEVITQRVQLMRQDIQEIERQKQTLLSHGNYFVVQNNQTIPEEVIPWLLSL